MRPIIGIADSQSTIHWYLDAGLGLYHGIDIGGAYAFAAVPREGVHEIFAAFDADPKVTLLSTGLDDVVTDVKALKKLGKHAAKSPKVRDIRASLHALGATHLFDPRLG